MLMKVSNKVFLDSEISFSDLKVLLQKKQLKLNLISSPIVIYRISDEDVRLVQDALSGNRNEVIAHICHL